MSTSDIRDDVDAIKALKYRYLRCVDLRLWDELAQTLTLDVRASYGKRLSYTSRDELVSGLKKLMTDNMVSEHQVHHPEIEVNGDSATGSWYLQDRVIMPAFDSMMFGGAFYTDRYERVNGHWLISQTGYKRTFEAMINLKDVPSFTLTDNHLASPRSQ